MSVRGDGEVAMRAGTRSLGFALPILAFALGSAVAQPSDSGGDPLFADEAPDSEATSGVAWFGNFQLRGDSVDNLVGRTLDRVRLRGRLGIRFASDDWEFGAAVEAARGSDRNADNLRNNDNEQSDDTNLDQAYVQYRFGEQGSLLLGKTPLPLALSPLVWDTDLRPVGLSVHQEWGVGETDRMVLDAGYFAGDHLYGDDSRIAAAQLGWHWQEGAPVSGDLLFSLLHFDDLAELTRDRLSRTNRRVGNTLVSDYRLADLQAGLRIANGTWPLALRADLVRNFGADDQRDGARFSAVFGSSAAAGGWEFGYALQRAQRDAVMAAFSGDDWWFHSFNRGYSLWGGYGLGEHLSVQVSGFVERRDDQASNVRRLLVDLEGRW